MKKKRIFYEKMDSFGVFPDKRIKLDILFRSDDGQILIWTPPWKAVIDFTAAAKYIEETNKPRGTWMKDLNKSYEKLKEMDDLSKKIDTAAGEIAGILGNLLGDKRIGRVFLHLSQELLEKGKTEQIYYILSHAPTLDEFKIRLQTIVNVHTKHFIKTEFRQNFNLILNKVKLELDSNLNIREKKKKNPLHLIVLISNLDNFLRLYPRFDSLTQTSYLRHLIFCYLSFLQIRFIGHRLRLSYSPEDGFCLH